MYRNNCFALSQLIGDMSTSAVRQNFHPDCEAAVNKQINLELYASYVYQSMVGFLICRRLSDFQELLVY